MPRPTTSGSWCAGGVWNGTGTWGGTGMWGTGFGSAWLRNHPAAFDAWLAMRSENMTAMRAWFNQYRGALTSAAAQQALRTLWQDHWNDMKAFYQKYVSGTAWVAPSLTMWGGMMGSGGMMGGGMMWGTGYGTGWLLQHPAAFASWQTLRAGQMSQVRAWWTRYRAHPYTTRASDAWSTMRARHRAQDLAFMTAHGISTGTSWSYAGWMGMGGSWGGFGW